MGGCKCAFRSCPVGTLRYPKMHFFNFPVQNKERLEKWVEYSQFYRLNELTEKQAKNRKVCALHFRDECFMNYLRNRLTNAAIPTLDRLKDGTVLDYSMGPSPKPIVLPPPKEKHMIPPPGVQILGHSPTYWKSFSTVMETYRATPKRKVDEITFTESPKPKQLRIEEVSQTRRILNKEVTLQSNSLSSNGPFDIDDSTTVSLSDEIFHEFNEDDENSVILENCNVTVIDRNNSIESNESTSEVLNSIVLDDIPVEFLSEENIDSIEEEAGIRKTTYKTSSNSQAEIVLLKKEMEERKKEHQQKIDQLEAQLAEVIKLVATVEENDKASDRKLKECEKKLAAAELSNQQLLKAKASEPAVASSSMGKPQLFNGIKKYLSASMTALVRMEMFGNSERAWKPDEKQVSVELLQLGEQIFEYFRDEWRFRLPPKKMVEQWSTEVVEEDMDDM